MSKWHQWSLPATREGLDVLGSYGQLLCKASSFGFAQEIEEALNRQSELDRLKAEAERYRQALEEASVPKYGTRVGTPRFLNSWEYGFEDGRKYVVLLLQKALALDAGKEKGDA